MNIQNLTIQQNIKLSATDTPAGNIDTDKHSIIGNIAVNDNEIKISGKVATNSIQSILGTLVLGSVSYNAYKGSYTINPTFSTQTLDTQNIVMTNDLTVNPTYVSKVSNLKGGNTVYIGGEYING